MDTEYQYETFNGLPVYYGGDMYDSDDSEEFWLDTPEEMDNRIQNQSRPDGGDDKSVYMIDVTSRRNTASDTLSCEVLDHKADGDSDTPETVKSNVDETDCRMRSHIENDAHTSIWISNRSMVDSTGHAEQLWLDKGDVACMGDFDDEDFTDTDVDSDDGSDMKVDSITGNSGNPQSDPDTDICTHAGKKELVPQCLLEWPSRREGDVRFVNNVNDRKLKHGLMAAWCGNAEDSSYISVCCDCLWLINLVRILTFVFCRWKILIHTEQEGPREGQSILQIKTADEWRCGNEYNTPPGIFSAIEILWPLIGCRPRMVVSAGQTSHIRKDPRVCRAVVAAPVTGSLVVISWLYLRDTAGTIVSHRKRTYGGTDRINGMVFRVWLHISVEGCNMDVATSVLPWNATEAVVDVSVAGVEIQNSLPDAMGLEGRTKYATRSRILRGRDPRSICVLIPVGQGG